jgi:peptidoglycan/LPS O-acetylase OafA/YrhL
MPHIKSLDGVRAVAVIPVVFFHLGMFPVGWIGVQIFFVLSGYLITGILLEAKGNAPTSYLARFYWRRSLRIFPLYLGFLSVAAFAFATSFKQDWPWLLTYTANLARLRDTDLAAPFGHFWSLAVEEQFYLVWPFVVYFTPVSGLRRLVLALLVLAPMGRLAIYLAFAGEPADWLGRTIYGLPTSQADAFAAGAMLVLFKIRHTRPWFVGSLFTTLAVGAAVIAHQHLAYHSAIKWSFGYTMFLLQDGGIVWGYSLLNLTAAFGIAAAIAHGPRLLQLPTIARLGVISYGIYVYHRPLLIVMERLGLQRTVLVPLYLMATYAIAELSFRCFESPFLRLKDKAFSQSIRRLLALSSRAAVCDTKPESPLVSVGHPELPDLVLHQQSKIDAVLLRGEQGVDPPRSAHPGQFAGFPHPSGAAGR